MGWDITYYSEVPPLKQITSILSKEFGKLSKSYLKANEGTWNLQESKRSQPEVVEEIWGSWPMGWDKTFYTEVPSLKQLASNFTLLCATFQLFETYFDQQAIWEGSLWVVNYWWRTTFSFVIVRSFFPPLRGQLGANLVKETTHVCIGHR